MKLSIINERENILVGGKGDHLEKDDIDPKELERGIKIEQEHIGENPDLTKDEKDEIAADITLDHEAEFIEKQDKGEEDKDDTYYLKHKRCGL
jgi:hypothetical protein